MQDAEFREVAVHEAAHAVLAYWLGQQFHWVMIQREGTPPGQVCRVVHDGSPPLFTSTVDGVKVLKDQDYKRVMDEAMIDLAGGLAVAKHRGECEVDWELHKDDWNHACETVLLACFSPCHPGDETWALLDWLQVRTRFLLDQSCIWLRVDALATALFDREPDSDTEEQRILWKEAVKIMLDATAH